MFRIQGTPGCPRGQAGHGKHKEKAGGDLWAGGNTPGWPKQGSLIKPFCVGAQRQRKGSWGQGAGGSFGGNQSVSQPTHPARDMLYLAMEGREG